MALLYVRNSTTRRCDRSPLFVILHQMVQLELRRRLHHLPSDMWSLYNDSSDFSERSGPLAVVARFGLVAELLRCESGSLHWLSFSHNIDDARYFCLICAPHYDENTTFGRRSFAPDARVHEWPIKATAVSRP
jgi:hypothetical protein